MKRAIIASEESSKLKVYLDDLDDFEPWGDSKQHFDAIKKAGKIELFESFLANMYPEGMSVSYLNNLLDYGWDNIATYIDLYDYEV